MDRHTATNAMTVLIRTGNIHKYNLLDEVPVPQSNIPLYETYIKGEVRNLASRMFANDEGEN